MTAVRCGWHTSANVRGIPSPNACSMLLNPLGDSAYSCAVVRFFRVHPWVEQYFNRQRHLNRDEKPLEEAGLGEREVIGVSLAASTLSTSKTITTPSSS